MVMAKGRFGIPIVETYSLSLQSLENDGSLESVPDRCLNLQVSLRSPLCIVHNLLVDSGAALSQVCRTFYGTHRSDKRFLMHQAWVQFLRRYCTFCLFQSVDEGLNTIFSES